MIGIKNHITAFSGVNPCSLLFKVRRFLLARCVNEPNANIFTSSSAIRITNANELWPFAVS
jgi:hypothetical protein